MRAIVREEFAPYTKTFRVAHPRDAEVLKEITRIARDNDINDSQLIRHILRRYVRAYNKRQAAA